MHIPTLLEELVNIIGFGINHRFNETALTRPTPELKPDPRRLGFRLEFENGDFIGLDEFMGEIFGTVHAERVNAHSQVHGHYRDRARRIFDEVIDHMTAPTA